MTNKTCITGMGIINAVGENKNEFSENIFNGISGVKDTRNSTINTGDILFVGNITKDISNKINRRLAKQSDRFVHLALIAAKEAIEDRNCVTEYSTHKKGIFFGNNSGGWDICEKGFFEFFLDDPKLVNPYQATAWFPTAPQGFTSITYNFKGYSKSFVADRLSDAQALYFANKSIKNKRNSLILFGGVESPITTFGLQCYYGVGNLSSIKNIKDAYLPFRGKRNDGLILGEGSAVLTLENIENINDNDVYAYLLDIRYIDISESKDILVKTIMKMLKEQKLQSSDIDMIIPEGTSIVEEDYYEIESLKTIFSQNMPIAITKHYFGHLFGAAKATDIVISILSMKRNELPPHFTLGEAFSEYKIIKNQKKNITYILNISVSKDKECIISLLKKGGRCND
ncbi:beta-ketoacyl synthase N-terminal-like domain-containing protein [Staphylococcus warneri]|nr:beta-ketoacyl synthase N-terminal-like domain-containing protein [Staphylococcus warneri]TBW78889.1 hypothetical protein EQ810_12225 [Staphylococcus warneri]